jgi:hypothetical protein
LIKFEAVKYHSNKRKADPETTGTSSTKKTKTTKKTARDLAEGSPDEDEVGDDADSIVVEPAKKPAAKKASPAKSTSAKATPAKAASAKATPAKVSSAKATSSKASSAKAIKAAGSSGFKNPVKPKAKKEPSPLEDEESENEESSRDGGVVDSIESDEVVKSKQPAEHGGSIFNNGALPFEKSASPTAESKATAVKDANFTFSIAGETPKSSKSKKAASSEVESPTDRLANKNGKAEVHGDEHADIDHSSPAVTGAKARDDTDIEDADLLAMAEDEIKPIQPGISTATTEIIETVAPLDTLIRHNVDRHDTPASERKPATMSERKANKLTNSLLRSSRIGSPLSEAHNSNSLNAQLANLRGTPGITPSVRSQHSTSSYALALSITLLATPNNGITNATSHLMVFPSSVTFAEVVGKYILQLPQGHADHQAMADAVSCTLRTASGKQQHFSIRDGAVERMWRAAIIIAARESRGLEEEQAIEVDIS